MGAAKGASEGAEVMVGDLGAAELASVEHRKERDGLALHAHVAGGRAVEGDGNGYAMLREVPEQRALEGDAVGVLLLVDAEKRAGGGGAHDVVAVHAARGNRLDGDARAEAVGLADARGVVGSEGSVQGHGAS